MFEQAVWIVLVMCVCCGWNLRTAYAEDDAVEDKDAATRQEHTAQGRLAAKHFQALYGPAWKRVDLAGLPVKGDPEAPVKMLVFHDFECPPCERFHSQTMTALRSHYKDKIAIYFVHFPLSSKCNPNLQRDMHPGACMAATAASCAQRQGKFWEMNDLLFEHVRERADVHDARPITTSLMVSFAERLKLDQQAFTACLDDPAILAEIKRQVAMGTSLNVNATPSPRLNGYLPFGRTMNTLEFLSPQIDRLLEIAAEAGATPSGEGGGKAASP